MESDTLDRVGYMQNEVGWNLCPTNHVLAMDLRSLCESITPRGRDRITWNNHSGPVTLSIIWDSMRPRSVAPSWINLVWHKLAVPKFSINLWLILRHRLLTRDRMARFGFNVNPICLFCNNMETHEHLFFNCFYISQILKECPVIITSSWQEILNGNLVNPSLDKMRRDFASLFVATTFYFVWAERNARCHENGPPKLASQLLRDIKLRIREKLSSSILFQQRIKKDMGLQLLLF
ncbi:uncharacterized protein LOC141704648 [Apium graveolens]|uniref:uncharacterized protein LOC141704648 n=1 Tax=Apium graveolens TaxID=4045 RepID=UPI003D7AB63B